MIGFGINNTSWSSKMGFGKSISLLRAAEVTIAPINKSACYFMKIEKIVLNIFFCHKKKDKTR